jgi:tetratricopeptide (TPR) repeat protein
MPLFFGQKSMFGNSVYIWEVPMQRLVPISSCAAFFIGAVLWVLSPLHPLDWLNRPWDPKAKMASIAEAEGNDLFSGGKYRLAIQAYSKALALKPERSSAHLSRGTAYWQLGQKQLARKDYLWVYNYNHAHPNEWSEKAAKIDGFKNSDEQFKKVYLSRVGGL